MFQLVYAESVINRINQCEILNNDSIIKTIEVVNGGRSQFDEEKKNKKKTVISEMLSWKLSTIDWQHSNGILSNENAHSLLCLH